MTGADVLRESARLLERHFADALPTIAENDPHRRAVVDLLAGLRGLTDGRVGPAMPKRPTLTLIHGEQRAEYAEHPVAVAKRALLEAAEVEQSESWPPLFRRVANALPDRGQSHRVGADEAARRADDRFAAERAAAAERKRRWRDTPASGREELVLSALGDEALTPLEVAERLHDEFGVCGSHAKYVMTGLIARGDVERFKALRKPGGVAWYWRYRRRVVSSPELDGLDPGPDRGAGS